MNMQHNFDSLVGRVSAKGIEQLNRIAEGEVIRESEILAASRSRADSALMAESGIKPAWICLQVSLGKEEGVEKLLREAGVEAIVPLRKGPVQRRRHKEIPAKDIPVIHGYVPVWCVPDNQAMRGLLGFEHVIGVIGGWENPYRVPQQEISAFKVKAQRGAYDYGRPAGLFRKDMMVDVTEGPFASFRGPIVSCRSDGTGDAVVELVLFGRAVPALIPLAMLAIV